MITNELHINPIRQIFVFIILLCTLIIAPIFAIVSSIFGHKLMSKT